MRLGALATLLVLAAAPATAATGITDPTKPPPAWMPVDPKAATKKVEIEEVGPPVQILLVGPTRRFALVRGELAGDKTSGTRLLDVKRNDVIVQSERGRETLNLFPDVQKTAPRKPAGILGNKDKK